jgi:hypothetical protein
MGADGHIKIYDYEKVKAIIDEMNSSLPENEQVDFPGYVCDWECNGKKACLIYWGEPYYTSQFDYAKENWGGDETARAKNMAELESRCAEAVIVRDQEVWT